MKITKFEGAYFMNSPQGVAVTFKRILVQTTLYAQPYLGTQPCYEAPGDLCITIVEEFLEVAIES